MKRAISISISCLLLLCDSFGQIRAPQTPQVSSFQPLVGSSQNSYYQPQYQQPTPQVRMGGTAQDVANQLTPRQRQTAIQKQQEVEALMREIERDNQYMTASNMTNSYLPNPERTKDFPAALQQLKDMLSGKRIFSVADAYFIVENAFGNCYLTKSQYDSITNQSASFIRKWMIENELNPRDNYMVHYAIKKFMAEPLTIHRQVRTKDKGLQVQAITHQPFFYDYEDYEYMKDHRNSFVTKAFATGFGQCASLPGVYLVLAEKLGVTAYLSFAPQHSFIKHPDNYGYIINYEPTSHWEISDTWYKDNMFISADAVRSGIYLDTLNSAQVVANCIFDLAVQYIKVDRTMKEDFIVDCIRAGIPFFPKNNNLPSLFVYGMHMKTMLREAMRKHNITRIEDIEKVPEVYAYFKEYIGNEAYIAKLGYQDLPEGMYEEMLQEHEFKGRMQENTKVDTKAKRSLFQTQ